MTESVRVETRVSVLGPVQVAGHSGAPVDVPGVNGRALIVALVLAKGTVVSVPALVDDIWQDEPPRNGKAALQTLVSRVRAVAGDELIESVAGGYRLGVGPDCVDLWRPDAPRRGEPGADLGELELAGRLRATADSLRAESLADGAATALDGGDPAAAARLARQLVDIRPFDEAAELLLMTALAASGHRNDALRSFVEFKERLADELGTDPGDELIACNLELLRQESSPESPQERAVHHVAIGVRAAPNALIGREHDVEALEGLIAHSRLTTILGAGGLGKTRLAQTIAGRATATIPAVIVVELAGVRDPDDVPVALASTLGIGETSAGRLRLNDPLVVLDLRTRIVAALGDRPTLIVLDNCEHVIDAAAYLVDEILAAVPTVRVLATSRAPLRITAESVYPLEPLPADEHGSAVQLFLERARASRPGAALPLDVVARLCERLEGLPLAIELAAARIRSMSVEEIERRLGNRFALLRGGDRSAPERHRTLIAVIDWSWNLLDESERRLLRRLSRFPGGFSTEAAIAVSRAGTGTGTSAAPELDELRASDDLDALVLQSLVNVSESPSGGMRYRMLETVREFGDMALVDAGEDKLVAEATAHWARAFALRTIDGLESPQQVEALRGLELEYDNLLAVLRRAVEGRDASTVFPVFAVLLYFWMMHTQIAEVTSFITTVIPVVDGATIDAEQVDAASLTLSAAMVFAFAGAMGGADGGRRRGPARPADGNAEKPQSLPQAPGPPSTRGLPPAPGPLPAQARRDALRQAIRLRAALRALTPTNGRVHAVRALLLSPSPRPASIFRVLAELRASEDPRTSCFAMLFSGMQAENMGEPAEAERLDRAAYEGAIRLGDTWMRSQAAQNLSQLASQQDRPEDSVRWSSIARAGLLELGAVEEIRQLEWHDAMSAVKLGDPASARATFEQFTVDDEDHRGFDALDVRAIGWAGLAELAALDGDAAECVRLYRRANAVFEQKAKVFAPWYQIATAGAIAASVFSGSADDPETRLLARELRLAVRVDVRMHGGAPLTDRPVLGSALVGLSAWLLSGERDGATAVERTIGVELLALGSALHSRQDQPALVCTRHEAAARAVVGAAALSGAKARVAALPDAEARVVRALELLAQIRI